jgi:bifunctional non-homologous end joining protein LigD
MKRGRTARSPRVRKPRGATRQAVARRSGALASMRLRQYRRRRDFTVTPEPAPGGAPARAGRQPRFMVHEHHARRLHYDLRLEIEGALASWAIPKGPSYDPAQKRLAIETEDHPLEYADFEGRIPEGEYGAGESLIWDRGTYETIPAGQASRQRAKGHLHVDLHGEKLRGGWHLVRTRPIGSGKQQWLLFKAKDEAADPSYDVVAARPGSVVIGTGAGRGPARRRTGRRHGATRGSPSPGRLLDAMAPMLATLVDAPPEDEGDWVFEPKYDGIRALAAVAGGRVAIRSRNGQDLTGRFSRLALALARLTSGPVVLDGEIAVLDRRGIPRFQLLQHGHDDEAVFFVFDLLRRDDEDLRERPLEERRRELEQALASAPPPIYLAEQIAEPAREALRKAMRRGYEGLIAKRRRSHYEGRRSRAWLKIKAGATQDVAIVGFTAHKAEPRAIGALLVAIAEDGEFRFAGKVGTGFSARQRMELKQTLARHRAVTPPVKEAPRMAGVTWVAPRLVGQVRFTEWTSDGRLRHPAFEGLREDKTPRECVREHPAVTGRRAGGGERRRG